MTQEQIKELDVLRYRISRLNNLIFELKKDQLDIHNDDLFYINNYVQSQIDMLKKEIEQL